MIRGLEENKIWIQECFKRDNFTCQECKKIRSKNIKIEVHHIKEFSKILQEFLQTYSQFSPTEDKETLVRLAINYQLFWNISNGKTLCIECHEKTYKKSGVKICY
jgi:5-methylcytosine-specific restriction endonuclease McrA